MEGLEEVKGLLKERTPISCLQETLEEELWEEEQFQQGHTPPSLGLQTVWDQLRPPLQGQQGKMTNRRGQKQKLYCLLLPRISSDNFRKHAVGQPVTWPTTSYPPCSCNARPTATIIPFRLPTSSHLPAPGEISTVRKIAANLCRRIV
jgi:hypothetical protein